MPGYDNNKWKLNSNGVYSTASGYQFLLQVTSKVNWIFWVWNRLNAPKHAFICWMVMWDRLKTKHKLYRFGILNDNLCAISGIKEETSAHLFFECPYAKACIDSIFL